LFAVVEYCQVLEVAVEAVQEVGLVPTRVVLAGADAAAIVRVVVSPPGQEMEMVCPV
jgi:hypothetical protein